VGLGPTGYERPTHTWAQEGGRRRGDKAEATAFGVGDRRVGIDIDLSRAIEARAGRRGKVYACLKGH